MFYTAYGVIEHFEDIVETSQITDNSQNVENIACDEKCYNTGFIQANTTLPHNIIQFKEQFNIQTYNSQLVEAINIDTFRNNTVNIIMDLIFNFINSLIGTNKPFITNIFNNNNNTNKNKLIFKYYDQYGYEVNLQSDYLLNKTLYNIVYLPIQPKIDISIIDATKLNVYNIMNGTIITITNDISISLLPNKIFEIYIYSLNDINLYIYYFENKKSQYTLNKNTYYHIYYNINTNEPISITILNTVNMYIITTPVKVNLISDNNLIYYNNFINYKNKYFYNTVSKSYDTQIVNINCDNCNIKEYGSRSNKMSYYGFESYIQLPELNLNYPIITFSINFNTSSNKNSILFDIGRKINDKLATSLFVNFEGKTVRFNHIENRSFNTFIYVYPNINLIDGKWHNIIWTINNNTGEWTIIIDTVRIIYKSTTKINFRNSSNFNNNFIGIKSSITDKPFMTYAKYEGFIDNFKIYNRELMPFQIINENIK